MGYHLIIRNPDGTISPHYSDTYEGLVEFPDITEDSIIYQGEAHWKPEVLGKNAHYRNLAHDWFRAGIKAQKLFKHQAVEHGLMIEELSQDVESFKAYTSSADVSIKRGDFLLRNVRNIEIEVKCFTFYENAYIYVDYSDVKRHENMQKYSGAPVVLAIYQRQGDAPVPDSLRMVYIQKILEENNKAVRYEGKSFIVPLSLTLPGFALIDDVRKRIESA